ncbi:MAG: SDR family oxidoreductase [Thermodesulfobacteriota bacterium]
MTTLITGGTGFIGSHLLHHLLGKGESVKCLVRKYSDTEHLDRLHVEKVVGDVTDIGSLRKAIRGCNRVYHLAGVYAIWLANTGRMYQVNEEGTRNTMTVCREADVERIVYCSSTAALGAHGKTPAGESARFNLMSTRDHYYMSKYRAEQIVLQFAGEGLPVIIVNPTVPVGTLDRNPTPSGELILNVLKGKLPAYVDGGFNVVDVSDCAQAMIQAMQVGAPGEKYILGNRNVRVKEFFDLVVRVAGRGKSPAVRIPKWAAVSSGYAYQTLSFFTRKAPLTSASWARVGSHYSWWDCAKARRDLSLGQRDIEESIREAVSWFEQNGYTA